MPTSSESSLIDKTLVQKSFERLAEAIETALEDSADASLLRARIEWLKRMELSELGNGLSEPFCLLQQVKAVSEGQLCLIHVDRTEVRSLFTWRAASYERTAQIFDVDPDDFELFHESVLDAQVECLYRQFDERLGGAEDDFWDGSSAPGPFMDRMYQLTLDALSEDECLFVECLAAARKREEERERGCGSTA
jgi:hypothetical protein